MGSSDPALPVAELERVVKRFRLPDGGQAGVFGLDLEVRPGEIVALLGPNGAGKTTAVRILVGLLEPDEGNARIAGHDLAGEPLAARRSLGYVPDGAPLYAQLTAEEHVALVAGLHGIEGAVAALRAANAFEGLELAGAQGRPVGSFSRGMRQKLALALALLPRPRLLVLDEPLSGLDASSTIVIKELLRAYAQQGNAVLITSHLLDVVERLADRLVVLRDGLVIAAGSFRELSAKGGEATLEELFKGLVESRDPSGIAQAILCD